ncbi:phosphohistidine phosphatase [Methanolinea mesophila]|uniref:phosphohistidine phosphatase SixA n=1 Tax=Methanolinea mesophila TaxID=547055 RepID=UPI001AEAB8C5|nr:phosphohistidine phosphatase SixA [Methanolinea mesophila]MBP1927807.1 phosphohistidine phosphatase [Methanolinea mesophila]
MDLILFRHGKAGKRKEYTGDDRLRPLTDEGIQDLVLIAGWLRRQDTEPGLIATSPLARASQTAAILADELQSGSSPETWDELSPGNDPETVLQKIGTVKKNAVVILVGHEPDLSILGAYILTGRTVPFFSLSKGGLAYIEEGVPGRAGTGALRMLMPARLMR